MRKYVLLFFYSARFLLLLSPLAESRTLSLASCSVNVHIHELRQYYNDIRLDVIESDTDIGVKLLDKSLMTNIQDGQTCCFVRLVLRFYIERVFSNYASSQPQHQRCSSALANAFFSIRRDIRECHCNCEEDTQRKIDSVIAEFNKLDMNQAAKKAVGELDTVLEWLQGLS
uniref:Interleukin family protein n=1 Tax=Gasterosteus aculeatus TaxID=69293 RepID=G3N5D8_GASAC